MTLKQDVQYTHVHYVQRQHLLYYSVIRERHFNMNMLYKSRPRWVSNK